jgi:inner membrane protein involved in colicin E2 resistance
MKKPILATAGLVALAALYFGSGAAAQSSAPQPVDLRNAAVAEVRDGQGQVVLKGDFTSQDEDDDDTERKAELKSVVANAKATGNAEIEFANQQPKEQEVEFAGRDLTPGATYTLAIDGHAVATATANKNGRLEIEVNVPLPGATAPR